MHILLRFMLFLCDKLKKQRLFLPVFQQCHFVEDNLTAYNALKR